ncbi:hypothetical protein XELAEV_18008343mg [Xenopus laevis]|uniref:EGF-like domain-containing protein n=1 Tax=Xenopus laevis TaxID=8355 RepID=A0A974E3H3_XENLA|nr:hypothetical protein XELAEV_18008343mg [Xenopus laevis]
MNPGDIIHEILPLFCAEGALKIFCSGALASKVTPLILTLCSCNILSAHEISCFCLLQPSPIYSLIPTDIKGAQTKARNLERAIEEYIDEYSVCKCQPCQNGGKAMVIDGECICNCPLHYEGVACQNIKAEAFLEPKEPIDGGWGCWTVSPNCVNGDLTATRKCDNPVPQEGGKTCHGSQTKTIPCEK